MYHLIQFIKEDLKYGYEVRVYWGYRKDTDIYENCVIFKPWDKGYEVLEKLLKITATRFIFSFNRLNSISEITLD